MTVGELIAKFKLDFKDFSTGVTIVQNQIRTLGENTKSVFASIKQNWMAATAILAVSGLSVQRAWRLAETRAQFDEQMDALNNLAARYRITSDDIVRSVKKASDGMISMADAARISGKAMLMEMSPDQIVKFMEIVVATTNVTGKKVSESFEAITEAAAAGRERSLKQMGIIIDLEKGYEKFANRLGKHKNLMTEVERSQAGVNYILENSNEILKRLGPNVDSVADKMERFKAQIEDLRLIIGGFVIKGGAALIGIFQGAAAAAWLPIQAFSKLTSIFGWMTDQIGLTKGAFDYWNEAAENAMKTAEDLAKKGHDNLSLLFEDTKRMVKSSFETSSGKKDLTYDQRMAQMKFQQQYLELWGDRLGALEVERKIAIEEAKKTGIGIELIEKIYAQKRILLLDEYQKAKSEAEEQGITDNYNTLTQIKQQESDAAAEIAKLYQENEANFKKSEEQAIIDNYEALVKRRQDEEDISAEAALERVRVEKELMGEIAAFTKNEYEFKKKYLDKTAEDYQKLGIDRILLEKWVETQLIQIEEERTLRGEDFVAGMKVAYDRSRRDLLTWAQGGADTFDSLVKSFENSMSDFFFDSWTGKLKSASDYFESFKNSILRTWANMISRMIAEWMAMQAIKGIGALFGGGNLNAGVTQSPSAWGGQSAAAMHLGFIPRLHSGLSGNEFPAILQRGEAVIRQSSVNSRTAPVLENINKTGNVPGGEVHNHFYIHAVDAPSFVSLLARNRNAISQLVANDHSLNGPTRKMMR